MKVTKNHNLAAEPLNLYHILCYFNKKSNVKKLKD